MWDPENRYTEGFLKEYTHWVLEISYRQHTLGCYIIFAKRDIERISQLRTTESEELPRVMNDIETTLQRIDTFRPDRFNYLQLGNGLHHLHLHGIPRYQSSRMYHGTKYQDATWGSVPVWSKTDVSHSLVKNLVRDITPALPE